MIIYSETKGNFIQSCKADKNGDTIEKEVTQMMLLNGIKFFDEAQKRAWRNSLPAVAQALEKTHISDECIVAVEYTVRQARERLDFVITGKDSKDHRNMIIVELKQWSGVSVSAMDYYVLANVAHGIIQEHWHPSYQARNYGNIISNTYEVIQSHNIGIYSCSFLHNMPKQFGSLIKDQVRFPLLAESPCFLKEDVDAFAAFLGKYVESADTGLLAEIDSSKIVTSKQLSDMILDALHGNPFFSYDKGQAAAVEKIKSVVNDCLEFDERRTIIIKGGPGTGKSVVALNVLGQLTKPEKEKKTGHNVIYCTVNAAPRTVYKQELVQGDFTKAIVEFLRANAFIKKTFREIDYKQYTHKENGYFHLALETKINLLKKLTGFDEISVCEDCTEAYIYWKDHFNHNKNDCCNLNFSDSATIGKSFKYIGNSDLMKEHKTAFLCSSNVSTDVRRASIKWAEKQCIDKNCIISGFQSEAEKDVLDVILAEKGLGIMVLPHSIYEKCPSNLWNAVNEGRLLIISFFEDGIYRISRSNAEKRNHQVLECADTVVIGYAKKDGMIAQLINNSSKNVKILYE